MLYIQVSFTVSKNIYVVRARASACLQASARKVVDRVLQPLNFDFCQVEQLFRGAWGGGRSKKQVGDQNVADVKFVFLYLMGRGSDY